MAVRNGGRPAHLTLYLVRAFASPGFGGNPAAVVPLRAWLEDHRMQAVARDVNLSETAFVVRHGGEYQLRWFSPNQEVPLCGHATLAAAWVAYRHLQPSRTDLVFHTRRGPLFASRSVGDAITIAMPSLALTPRAPPRAILAGLRSEPSEVLVTEMDPNYYAIFEEEAAIRALSPSFTELERLHPYGVAASAPGTQTHFVSRYFAPGSGIPEDPVTGSTHCALAPYWSGRLGVRRLKAYQLSPQRGELRCVDAGDRVLLSGGVTPDGAPQNIHIPS